MKGTVRVKYLVQERNAMKASDSGEGAKLACMAGVRRGGRGGEASELGDDTNVRSARGARIARSFLLRASTFYPVLPLPPSDNCHAG